MIKIINITPPGVKSVNAVHRYQLYINDKLVTSFKHFRTPEGLAECLRDAANAVEKELETQKVMKISRLAEVLQQANDEISKL